jgi:serine/threonine protein kinase
MSDDTIRSPDTWEGPRNEGPGGQIGPYRLLKKLGEGGFGVVFEAEQEEPVKRRVALKVIKLGMDTAEVIVRFEAERQALAMMDHPHIATVLDAGATDSGRPYFVMELVEGQPISEYCDANNLSVAARLELFDQVCTAVQHAHTKGIIHRDLKPNNVLVHTQDGEPFAKVIDFGIAKATSGRLTDKTLLTELHQVMGTPLYMSPEQAEGSSDIDTRTDIYSLGAMLYELLTGTTPVDSASMRSAVFAEVQRLICEVDPPLPSTRLGQSDTTLSGVATHRSMDSRKLTRTVKGDLDWIVMKALEKDRGRRYETANGLAMDLRRYLAHEPVLAAPPSASYRLQKFVRRNKATVAAGSLIAASLMVGIVAFAWQARIAQMRAAELEQVSKFQEAMLAQVNPTDAGELLSKDVQARFDAALAKAGVPAAVRATQTEAFVQQWQRVNATDAATNLIDATILKPAVSAIDKQFKSQPVIDATLRETIAHLYVVMGMYDTARPLQERALAIRRRVLGDEHPDTLRSLAGMGRLLQDQGKLDEAERYDREALQKRRRVLGEDHPDTLLSLANMGVLLDQEGKTSEAEPLFRDALERRRRVVGEDDPGTLFLLNDLGTVLDEQGKSNEAEGYYRMALEKRRRILGENDPDTLISISNLGFLLQEQGKLGEAEPYLREALVKSRRVLGEEHQDTLLATNNLGLLLQSEGKLREAEPYLRDALEKFRRLMGDKHIFTLASTSYLASLLEAQGRHSEALELLIPVETTTRDSFTGGDAYRFAKLKTTMGMSRAALGQFSAAESSLLEADGILVSTPGPNPKDLRDCTEALVRLYTAWNTAEPGKGHDAKAAEWSKKLAAIDAPN